VNVITSPEQLLALPVHERQTVVILSDAGLREIGQLASPQQADQRRLRELAVGFGTVGASMGGERLREIVRAGTTRAAANAPIIVPALALVGACAGAVFLFNNRSGNGDTVTLVSASAAQGLTFREGPFELGVPYSAHPMQHERYLPAASFPRLILEERTSETQTFLITCCGASEVEIAVYQGDELGFDADASYDGRPRTGSGEVHAKRGRNATSGRLSEGPGRSAPNPLIPSEWIWFAAEPEWQEIHRQRRDAGITSYHLTTVIKDERSIDLKALAKLPGVKPNAGLGVTRHDTTVVTWNVSFPPV
jgi:hypothetical protein